MISINLILNIVLVVIFGLMLYLATMTVFQYLSTSTPTLMRSSTSSINSNIRANIYMKN